MKTAIAIWTLLALASPGVVIADDSHNHEAAVEPAPHGGILRDAAPYKAELVLNGAKARIYVYDKDLKPATLTSKTVEGKVRFPKDKKDKAVTFKRSGEYYEATIQGIDKVHRFDLHAFVTEGGKKTKMDFGIDNIH